MNILLFILLFDILLGSIGQILLKMGMRNSVVLLSLRGFLSTIFKMYLNKFVLIGSFVYAASTLVWIAVLSKIELS